jgi:hypothetical protein
MNFILNLAYEKSTWYHSIGLEEPIAQTNFNHPLSLSLLQKPYSPLRVPRKSYDILFWRFSALRT